jgi:hypothetical protein
VNVSPQRNPTIIVYGLGDTGWGEANLGDRATRQQPNKDCNGEQPGASTAPEIDQELTKASCLRRAARARGVS